MKSSPIASRFVVASWDIPIPITREISSSSSGGSPVSRNSFARMAAFKSAPVLTGSSGSIRGRPSARVSFSRKSSSSPALSAISRRVYRSPSDSKTRSAGSRTSLPSAAACFSSSWGVPASARSSSSASRASRASPSSPSRSPSASKSISATRVFSSHMAGQELPIFELPIVLLPGEQLPLHIFEDQYKRMVGRALDQGEPFGIVLRDDDGARSIGCTARVDDVLERFEDGRLNIVVSGEAPFKVLDRFESPEYPAGEVELMAEQDVPPIDREAASAARE